jgi:hypothetical protein
MIIENKKTYSFNLPEYLGGFYVSVDTINNNYIDRFNFYSSGGMIPLFSVDVNIYQPEELLNKNTLAYIKAKINEAI